jgi:hypothetical protein
MNRENQDWARQIPWEHGQGPYEDFGWEPGESVLPEFRDSSIHNMPYEMNPRNRWNEHRRHPRKSNRQDATQGRFSGVGPKNYQRTDDRILEDVNQRLAQHGRLDASQIDVKVHQGVIDLEGNVRSRKEKRLAEDIADSVSGVIDIQNRLKIQDRQENPASGLSGVDRTERIGRSGVYPASGSNTPEDAEVRTMASWGQGERGASGYQDHGDSELPTHEDRE